MDRTQIADLIVARLQTEKVRLTRQYRDSVDKIGHFVLDDVLPEEVARNIHSCFPQTTKMRLKKSLREYKYIAAQMDAYNPILEEAVYAFQDSRVVASIGEICSIERLYPDEHLYAGGISLMGHKHFLNPHLDNSHDKDRGKWRVLNVLYYATPGWDISNGGNLELWPDGLNASPLTLHSKFNRIVVMATHNLSWHSVSPIVSDNSSRCCVSNYYFSETALKFRDRFRVTSFRGRPEQKLRDLVLRADIMARMTLRKLFKRGVVGTSHLYKK